MEEISKLREVQLLENELLMKVHEICKKHRIKYFLTFGSLLGGVRHQGFIPWDDDIDLTMPVEDYIRFIKIGQKELGDKFFLQTYDTDRNFYFPYTNIRINNTTMMKPMHIKWHVNQGIWIDIFPMVKIRNITDYNIKKYLVSLSNYLAMDDYIRANDDIFYKQFGKAKMRMLKAFYKIPFSFRHKLQTILISFVRSGKKAHYYAIQWKTLSGPYPKNIMQGKTSKILFEGNRYESFPNYKLFLEIVYGDYMTPVVDNRGHETIIYDCHKSYKEYL